MELFETGWRASLSLNFSHYVLDFQSIMIWLVQSPLECNQVENHRILKLIKSAKEIKFVHFRKAFHTGGGNRGAVYTLHVICIVLMLILHFLKLFPPKKQMCACLHYSLWHRLYWPSVVIRGRHLGFGQTRWAAQKAHFKFRVAIRYFQSARIFEEHRLSNGKAGVTSQHRFNL